MKGREILPKRRSVDQHAFPTQTLAQINIGAIGRDLISELLEAISRAWRRERQGKLASVVGIPGNGFHTRPVKK